MTAPAAPAAPSDGPLFDGKYQFIRTIGEGGMGAVHEAVNVRTGKHVAIKTMSPLISRDPSAVERFMREARSATMIEHPNVVQVFDVGVDPGGVPFMVMELLQGEPFTDLIEREGPLPPARVVQLMGPALGALAAAHARGIIHRDLKPDNIFLARTPGTGGEIPKLLDFGISKSMNPDGANMSLTHTGTLLGTPYYMAPEQAAGKRTVDQRSDIYAVGVILYYALSRHMPFNGDNYNALIVAILTESAPPLTQVAPHVSPAVAEVIDRAMKREMDQRYQSVEELVGALAYAAGQELSTASTTNDASFATVHAGNTARHQALQQSGITASPAAVAPPNLQQTPGLQRTVGMNVTPAPGGPAPQQAWGAPNMQATPHPGAQQQQAWGAPNMQATPHPGAQQQQAWGAPNMQATPHPGAVAQEQAWAAPNTATPHPGALGQQQAWAAPNPGMQATPPPGALAQQQSWSGPNPGMQATPPPGALGQQQAWAPPSAPAIAFEAPKKSRLPLVLGVLAGLFLLVGGAVAAIVVLFVLPLDEVGEHSPPVAGEPGTQIEAPIAAPVVAPVVLADPVAPVVDPAAPVVEPATPTEPAPVAAADPAQPVANTDPSGQRRRTRDPVQTGAPEPDPAAAGTGTRRRRSGRLDLSEF